MNHLVVGVGGIFGAVSRYALSSLISELNFVVFPFGTLIANLIGSFLLSFIAYKSILIWQLPKKYILAVNTGFIGSFTTFSTFSQENLNLIITGEYVIAIIYSLISVIVGLALSWCGILTVTVLYNKKNRLETQK